MGTLFCDTERNGGGELARPWPGAGHREVGSPASDPQVGQWSSLLSGRGAPDLGPNGWASRARCPSAAGVPRPTHVNSVVPIGAQAPHTGCPAYTMSAVIRELISVSSMRGSGTKAATRPCPQSLATSLAFTVGSSCWVPQDGTVFTTQVTPFVTRKPLDVKGDRHGHRVPWKRPPPQVTR